MDMVRDNFGQEPSDRGQTGNDEGSPSFRFYSCNDPNRLPKRVLVFIHVFKTGGSSIRRILTEMAGDRCKLGYATIVRGKLKISKDRFGQHRNHQFISLFDPETLEYVRQHIDMVGGHQHFDTANTIWPELPESAFGKIAYVRDPLHRFTSGKIFVNKNRSGRIHSVRDTVEFIRQDVDKREAPKIRYWKDLATEAESRDPRLRRNYDKQVEIIKSRLDRLVMVGVVERWQQSLGLLQNIVCPGGSSQTIPRRHANKSKIPTAQVVSELKLDEGLHKAVLHHLSYEQEIYQHALAIHLEQCARAGIR